MLYNFAAEGFYIIIMKLCSILFVLYCRSRPKDDKSRYFHPHFEEVKGSVEPWWMARWKARAEFLLSLIELLFTARAMLALQAASVVLATAIPSVCLSVCPSHGGIVSKRRHVALCSLRRWIAKCV